MTPFWLWGVRVGKRNELLVLSGWALLGALPLNAVQVALPFSWVVFQGVARLAVQILVLAAAVVSIQTPLFFRTICF